MEVINDNKKKLQKWILPIIISIVAVIVIGLTFVNSSKNKNENLDIQLSENSIEHIVNVDEKTTETILEVKITRSEIISDIELVVQKWKNKEITSEEAINSLQEYKEVGCEEVILLANEKISFINLETNSDRLYGEAENYYNQGKYVKVFSVLKDIAVEYSRYTLVEELNSLCKEKVLEKVSNPYTIEEYEKSISYLEECIQIVNDKDFSKRKDVLSEELVIVKDVSNIINIASDLYDKKMYEEAFAMLAIGLEQYPTNERIELSLVEFHNHYIIYITKQVSEFCKKEEYKEAVAILDDALSEYECKEFIILKEKVKEEKSVLYKIKNDVVAKVKFYAQEITSEEFDVRQLANDTSAYIMKSGEKLMLGDYSEEDITVLSFTGNVVASLAGVDFAIDLRDVTYDITHWGQEEYFIIHLATDVIALVPVIGMVKYLDHFKVAKAGIKTATDMVDSVADVGKNTEASVDAIEAMITTAKSVDKIIDATDSVKDIAKNSEMAKVIYKNIAKGYKFIDTPNFKLLGKTHSKTKVKFVLKKVKYSSGEMLQGVFPVFKSYSDVQLPKKFYKASFDEQQEYCLKELKKQTKSFVGNSKRKFTKEQLEDIDNGILPEGFTWHHNEKEGLMQLVETSIHAATSHKGGMSLWGRGY